ncbi:MAG TPA: hypothetical protein PKH97_03225 [Tetrasphaera sp.]|uniref:Uncharacterized protein n=1 Tax=Nostocoides vanveenii TaxID=330835 RepID=A0ABN2L886_9MICO|nr:hypothetical protein [Tetrasphaera sp.]HNQ06179.1 hypothetical protein [Tetrasphaera sp.]
MTTSPRKSAPLPAVLFFVGAAIFVGCLVKLALGFYTSDLAWIIPVLLLGAALAALGQKLGDR